MSTVVMSKKVRVHDEISFLKSSEILLRNNQTSKKNYICISINPKNSPTGLNEFTSNCGVMVYNDNLS